MCMKKKVYVVKRLNNLLHTEKKYCKKAENNMPECKDEMKFFSYI